MTLEESLMRDQKLRLGVNIDHIATVRNARGTVYPDPMQGAKVAELAGADGITAHLREDRRHIMENDIKRIRENVNIPLNLEMAATEEMQEIALLHKPHAVCLVPENRLELTTEGGLDVIKNIDFLVNFIKPLKDNGSRVSIFLAADRDQIEAAFTVGASVVELHTGEYCEAHQSNHAARKEEELRNLNEMAEYASSIGLEVHAGHGLCLDTVGQVAAIKEFVELNIGHSLIADSIFVGLDTAIKNFRSKMEEGRK
tara:strand:- start:533 stop:1300 length:768 start_codon:yes stop_codon:yes gene_type:complete